MSGPYIEAIFLTGAAGEGMRRVHEVRAIVHRGLERDRYASGTGYYSRHGDVCELTLIEGEVLDEIGALDGIQVQDGEHRRNIVTRGLALPELRGRRLRIGAVVLEYDRPRTPCGYVERLTENGMTRALGKGAGIGMRVLTSGILREGDGIELLAHPAPLPLRRLP